MKLIAPVAGILLLLSSAFLLKPDKDDNIDDQLEDLLNDHHFDGRIQEELEKELGRKLNQKKVNLGRLIFFDKGLGLHEDNSCAGCHAPNAGFGDSQPIAIGVNNNDTVGTHRKGPRNQRRTPTVINTAFFPSLMWNGRFTSLKDDPFDNGDGFEFPPPEGDILFNEDAGYLERINHLLVAQAHIPFTEQPEMAGFTTTDGEGLAAFSRFSGLVKEMSADKKPGAMIFETRKGKTINNNTTAVCPEIDFSIFNDGRGLPVPPVDPDINSANFGIRDAVLSIINANAEYKRLFGEIYPDVKRGRPIDFVMIGEVLAEFEFSLTFAQSPLDEYAKGNRLALTANQKKGAVIFFFKGKCVTCHSVDDESYQMFSDFKMHNAGVPQVHPVFGIGTGNVPFSSLSCAKTVTGTLDFGREEFTGNIADRYKFRSSPLRNLKLQPFFFHNGSFNNLKDAVTFHLNPSKNINAYQPARYGVPADLKYNKADMTDVMTTLDPLLKQGILLTAAEINSLVDFLSAGLYDKRLTTPLLKSKVPATVPTGIPMQVFEFGSTAKEIIVTDITRPEHNSLPGISLYPNPVKSMLSVQIVNDFNASRADILNQAGALLLSREIAKREKRITLPVNKLPSGNYLLRVIDNNGKTLSKQFRKE